MFFLFCIFFCGFSALIEKNVLFVMELRAYNIPEIVWPNKNRRKRKNLTKNKKEKPAKIPKKQKI